MATHTLVTGVNGAGKTLYTVFELVKPICRTHITVDGIEVERRVMCNIRELILDHEPMTVPEINPEAFREPHPDLDRQPGEPPLEVEHSILSWWLWCKPGDVIVVDECQRAFRPFASGRRIPLFIARMEVARHYGVEFIYVTQHPRLLHTNIRDLVGRHLHVRRLYAGLQTIVYEWDHCTHPDKVKNATAAPWRHKKQAYGLYKSAEAHTKGKARIPLPIFILGASLLVVPALAWYAKERLTLPKASQAAPADPGQPAPTTHQEEPSANTSGFVAAVGEPAFTEAVRPRKTWPEAVTGCWMVATDCKCITQEMPPRIIADRPAMCLAIVMGDLVPPLSHPRPVRTEPDANARQVAGPDPVASSPRGA